MTAMDPHDALTTPRRVVIGLDPEGRSAVVHDGPASAPVPSRYPGIASTMLWKEGELLDVASREDQVVTFADVPVPAGGTRFFVTRIEPGVRADFHTTATVEYHYVVAGRIVSELEGEDVEIRAGDTLIMRGVPHGWYNPSETEPWISVATMVDMSSSFGA
jgi:quercetin dioxygenase-like cupin family protein